MSLQVLYLDSDNLPLFNPDVLFNEQDYKLHGSMFWPDIYCGSPRLHELLGMPASDAAQTESGQYIFDRERHWMVLEWLLWLNTRDEIVYSEAYGDKDTFKAAFFLANRLEEFYQVPHPLGLGLYDVSKEVRCPSISSPPLQNGGHPFCTTKWPFHSLPHMYIDKIFFFHCRTITLWEVLYILLLMVQLFLCIGCPATSMILTTSKKDQCH